MKNNIRGIREKQGITQAELARRLNFSRSYMNKVERGTTAINVKLAIRIANVLNVTLDEIFFGTDVDQ